MSEERWKIELLKVGLNNVCRVYESRCDTLAKVEGWALTHCKKYLASKFVHLEHHGDLIYGVYGNSCLVGWVKITSIPKESKCQKHRKHSQ